MSGLEKRLIGKTALITGAGSGVGQAMAELFAAHGARVVATSRRESSLEKWQNVENVLPLQADITDGAAIERMFDEIEGSLGALDIVCNVAGINDLGYPLHETSDERWDRVVDLDLKAPFRICRRAVPKMLERGGGVILNVASYAALRGNHGPTYTAAKQGLLGLTASMAVAYGGRGIRSNAINPGEVNNTEIEGNSGGEYHPEGHEQFIAIVGRLPVKWDCEPEDIAPLALFLCSDEAHHINGAVIAADGGMSAC